MPEPTGDKVERWRDAALHGVGLCRRWAVRRLTRARGAASARVLGEVVVRCGDDPLRRRAAQAVATLTGPAAIEAVCELALDTGSERLRQVLVAARHVPSSPELGALWLLLTEQVDRFAELDLGRADQAAVDAVCQLALDTGNERLREVLAASGRLPSSPALRALWLLLDGQFDHYAEKDFDGTLLHSAYRNADAGLRRRIAEQARAAGRVEWITAAVVADAAPGSSLALDDEQWQTTLQVHVDNRRHDRLWQLLPRAPLRWAARILVELGAGRWRPSDDVDRAGFETLAAAARDCRTPPSPRSMFGEAVVVDSGPVLAVSPRGDLMVTATDRYGDHRHRGLWRLPAGELLWKDENAVLRPRCAGFSPDGSVLALATSSEVTLWSVPRMTLIRSLPPARGDVEDVLVTADERVVTASAEGYGGRGFVQIWDAATGRLIRTVAPHIWADGRSRPPCIAATPDGRMLATAWRYPDGHVSLWCLDTGELLQTLVESGYSTERLTISADGALLLSENFLDNRLWRLPSGTPVGPLPSDTPAGPIAGEIAGEIVTKQHLTMSPCGRLLIGGSQVWRTSDLRPVGRVPPYFGGRTWRAVSADGSLFLVEDDRKPSIDVWHLPEGTRAGELDGDERPRTADHQLLMSTGGAVIAAGDGRVVLWPPYPALDGSRAVGDVLPSELAGLRAAARTCPPTDRPWLTLLGTLVRWQHRHDVAVSATEPGTGPGATDVELGA